MTKRSSPRYDEDIAAVEHMTDEELQYLVGRIIPLDEAKC